MDCMVFDGFGGAGGCMAICGGSSIHSMLGHACGCVGEACALY